MHIESSFLFFFFSFFQLGHLVLDIPAFASGFFLEIQGGLLSGIFAPHLLFSSLPENVRN